jgi:hypothetical protein
MIWPPFHVMILSSEIILSRRLVRVTLRGCAALLMLLPSQETFTAGLNCHVWSCGLSKK